MSVRESSSQQMSLEKSIVIEDDEITVEDDEKIIEKIIHNTEVPSVNFYDYLNQQRLKKKYLANQTFYKPPSKYSLESFSKLIRFLLTYSNKAALKFAMKTFSNPESKCLCVFETESFSETQNSASARYDSFYVLMKIESSFEKVHVLFENNLIYSVRCSCFHNDITWCFHSVLAILFLHSEELSEVNIALDTCSKASKKNKLRELRSWSVIANFGLCSKSILKAVEFPFEAHKNRVKYLEFIDFRRFLSSRSFLEIRKDFLFSSFEDFKRGILSNIATKLKKSVKENVNNEPQKQGFSLHSEESSNLWCLLFDALDDLDRLNSMPKSNKESLTDEKKEIKEKEKIEENEEIKTTNKTVKNKKLQKTTPETSKNSAKIKTDTKKRVTRKRKGKTKAMLDNAELTEHTDEETQSGTKSKTSKKAKSELLKTNDEESDQNMCSENDNQSQVKKVLSRITKLKVSTYSFDGTLFQNILQPKLPFRFWFAERLVCSTRDKTSSSEEKNKIAENLNSESTQEIVASGNGNEELNSEDLKTDKEHQAPINPHKEREEKSIPEELMEKFIRKVTSILGDFYEEDICRTQNDEENEDSGIEINDQSERNDKKAYGESQHEDDELEYECELEKSDFDRLLAFGRENDLGYSKDFCGCVCHKLIRKFGIRGKGINCHLCEEAHRKISYNFGAMLTIVISKLREMLQIQAGNYFETDHMLKLIRKLSRFVFYANKRTHCILKMNGNTKKKLDIEMKEIFISLFLSLNLGEEEYNSIVRLYESWKKYLFLNNVPVEGWFGEKMKQLFLEKQKIELFEIAVVSNKRTKSLLKANRHFEGLCYSCSNSNYLKMAQFLAHMGRIEESKECINCAKPSHREMFEFAKMFSKTDQSKAFEFYENFLSREKKVKSEEELNWLIDISEVGENKQNEKIEILISEMTNIPSKHFKKIVSALENKGLERSARKIILDQVFNPERKMRPKMFEWAFEQIPCGDELFSPAVDKLVEVMVYQADLAKHLAAICEKLEAKMLYTEANKIGLKYLECFANFIKDNNIKRTSLSEELKQFLLNILIRIFASFKSEKKEYKKKIKTEKYMSHIFEIKNAEFLYEVCMLLTSMCGKEKVFNNVLILYGKKLFSIVFHTSEHELLEKTINWLLTIAFENEKTNRVVSSCIIKPEPDEYSKMFFDVDNIQIRSTDEEFSFSSVVAFTKEELQKVHEKFSQRCLMRVADFMLEKKLSSLVEVINICIASAKLFKDDDPEINKKIEKYFNYAIETSEEKAIELAEILLDRAPSEKNFERVSDLKKKKGLDIWEVEKEALLRKLVQFEHTEVEEANFAKAKETLAIIVREKASQPLICNFLKDECVKFASTKNTLLLLKTFLENHSKGEESAPVDETLWFCGFHFNLIVATLRGLSSEDKKEFVSFVEKQYPALMVKTAITFSQALTLLIEKYAKHITETKIEDFWDLLEDSRFMFEKAMKKQEWEMLIENVGRYETASWFQEQLEDWKSKNAFSTPMILIDE